MRSWDFDLGLRNYFKNVAPCPIVSILSESQTLGPKFKDLITENRTVKSSPAVGENRLCNTTKQAPSSTPKYPRM